MRRWLVWISLLATGCGPKLSTRLVETHAEAIEQPAPGMSLLAAAPIPKGRIVQLTLGGSHGFSEAPGHGAEGTALYVPATGMAGHLMFGLTESLELGLVARWSAQGTEAPARGAAPPPEGSAPGQGGVRLRGRAGGETLSLGYAVELGFRRINLAYGPSVTCEAEEIGSEWVPIDGTCYASRELQGRAFKKDDVYFALALYPVFRLAEGVYAYAGATLDEAMVGYLRSDVVSQFEHGSSLEKQEEKFESQAVFLPIAGLDLTFDETFGLLFMVKAPPLGDVDLPGPYYEAALTLSF